MYGLVEQYKQVHKEQPDYGQGANVDGFLRLKKLLDKHEIKSVLDFGCGKGRLVEHLVREGYDAKGYDPAVPKYADTDWEYWPCDAVVSTDVFEHIEKRDLEVVLEHFFYYQKPKLIFLHISCRKAVQILPNGENAHCTIMAKDTWLEWLKTQYPELCWRITYWNDSSKGVDIVGVA